MNEYAAAKQAYTASSVMTASPERLVVMLYDGAIRFLRQAATAMRASDLQQARNRLGRAEAIIDELNMALDMSQGELPEQLRAIYLFCKRYLIEATLRRDPDRIERVVSLLAELRESWDAIAAESIRATA
jgi:flagellar protein FliS